MKAYQVVEHGKPLEFRNVDRPRAGPHEVLVRTLVTGVCHTDVHVANGDWGSPKLPLTLGHEGVGVVEELGPETANLKIGDRVGIPWLGSSCMECYLCKAGRENLCEHQRQTGFVRDGSFAEYFVADERFAARLPSSISDEEAAPVLCAGVTAYRALRLACVQPLDCVVIAGACGGLGHMAVQYAKASSLQVVALDAFNETKKELMKSLGVDIIVDVCGEPDLSVAKRVNAACENKPIRAAIIFAPVASAVSDAVEYCSPGATIVCVGLPTGHFKIDVVSFILKELRLQASIVGTPRDLQEAIKLVAEGKVKAKVQIKPFECANDVLSDLAKAKITGRVVLSVGLPSAATAE